MPLVILGDGGSVLRANRAALECRDRGGLWNEIERIGRSVQVGDRVQFEDPETGATWDIVVDVIEGEGRDREIVVAARDVTTIVELQQSLRRSETMSALGALVGGVAHEVRNPLFAISSTLDAFEDAHGDRRELHGFFDILRGQVHRLSDLMSGLLELGRPAPAVLIRRSLAPIIEEAIALCVDEASANGVNITFPHSADLWAGVDERRLLQALRNVIHNAVQHSSRDGDVTVCTHWTNDARVLIHVSDEGSGFDPADLKNVFQPFFSRRTGGTGLGLSITRAVVEQHHGRIVAANRPGRGAIISIELPAA